jgi:restriction system protein
MPLWLVRAGSHGEQEQGAIEHNVATIGWNEMPDISKINNKEELKDVYLKLNPNTKKMRGVRILGQIWDFAKEIEKGDLIALPLKSQSAIVLGKVQGDYEFKELTPNIKHIRRVKWLRTIPRSQFDQDLLFSLGAFTTVCQIKRNDAENRVRKILEKGQIMEKNTTIIKSVTTERNLEESGLIDIEQHAKDQIVKFMAAKFVGHNLARLVEAILKAQGYVTTRSEPGKDGGIDILAGSGPLGFNEPRICAQIKSSSSPIDVSVLRELRGVMQRVGANEGLLVSWGGFTKDTIQEARNVFFTMRLWDQGSLLNEIVKHYEHFDDDLKAELPLKRIWTLVEELE